MSASHFETTVADIVIDIKTQLKIVKSSISESKNFRGDLKENAFKALKTIEELINQQRDKFKLELNQIRNAQTAQTSISYAKAAATALPSNLSLPTKTQFVVTVMPKDSGKTSATLKKEIQSRISPGKLGVSVSAVKHISRGGVLISCDTKGDAEKLKNEINSKLTSVEVNIPDKKMPKVIVYDIPEAMTEQEVLDDLKSQNAAIGDYSARRVTQALKIKFFTKTKREGLKNAVIEVNPEMRHILLNLEKVKLSWTRCSVKEFSPLIRCFKCLGFGHTSKYCEVQHQKCSMCAGDHHYKDCKANIVTRKCINCSIYNERTRNPNLRVPVNHSAMDPLCGTFNRALIVAKSKIDYGQ